MNPIYLAELGKGEVDRLLGNSEFRIQRVDRAPCSIFITREVKISGQRERIIVDAGGKC